MTDNAGWSWDKKHPENWTVDSETTLHTYPNGISMYSCKAHSSKNAADFIMMDAKNIIQCIALTPQKELVLVSQFRAGCKDLTLEFPGGGIEANESPLQASHRELREESGYTGENPILIWEGYPNPASVNNRIYYYFLHNCQKTHATNFDPTEDLATYLLPLNELDNAIHKNTFCHLITLGGLVLFQRWLRQNPQAV